MNLKVIAAIFRRNFTSYFSNPTGYVFICVFVLLGSFAAFWPDEFFNANLANLDQLNKWFPYIMLVFIPAITMSIWADERRQGTDELLLTIPATDFDVVLGKYFAAVAIYTVSLLFSFICNLIVLRSLGSPDVGLFLGTYFGYWMVGLAMLAVGMVASFLTGNLTVAFILGVIFNAPLVFLNVIDTLVRRSTWTATAKGWSIGEQMSDFGRGVISLSSIIYFLMIAIVMLYLCMVLIGRRHWLGGKDGISVGPHYLVRALALVVLAAGASLVTQNYNVRADATQGRLNSVSPQTRKMIADLQPEHPVVIEAYLSPRVPEEFIQTRIDLLNLLKEFEKLSGGKIQAKIYSNVEPLTEEAQRAERQFGITPQQVFTETRGVLKQEPIFLGAAITCGLEKIVIPFFERGVSVEYELVRSIATFSQQERKRLGVVTTDVELFGGLDFSSFRQRPPERLIEELEKQYNVMRVDPNNPITDRYDVMLAVQPSSLTAVQMKNFCDAIRKGQPTAIFEDPMPIAMGAPGTGQPRRPRQPNMMMMGQQPPEPKGDIKQLWNLLGVELVEKTSHGVFGTRDKDYSVVWQNFKPLKFAGIDQITPEWVFVRKDAPGADQAFNANDPASAGLQELLLLYPGGISKRNAAATDFEPLVKTGKASGEIMVKDVMESQNDPRQIRQKEGLPTETSYVLAAHITGSPRTDSLDEVNDADGKEGVGDGDGDTEKPVTEKSATDNSAAEKPAAEKSGDQKPSASTTEGTAKSEQKKEGINVILVADIDMLHSEFFDLRARRMPDNPYQFESDNVPFVLNVLDVLAGDMRFVDLRNRRPLHRPLEAITEKTADARSEADATRREFEKSRDQQLAKLEDDYKNAQSTLQAEIDKLKKEGSVNPAILQQKAIEMSAKLSVDERRKNQEIERLRREAQTKIEEASIQLNNAIRKVQDRYKLGSVLFPPLLPLAVAFFVFFSRRAKEREGVSKSRLR
ncbi:MAG: Gldg family protein [Pirellulales bacterium]|nr:Gldg family protein [Pirellulales bacterium]